MYSYVLDLNLKTIRSDVAIWRVYPGTRNNFVGDFLNDGCVFLELPGLLLKPDEIMRRHDAFPKIARAKAFADWYFTSPSERKSQPDSDLASYIKTMNNRSVGSAYGNVIRLFKRAKVGDLVIVPEVGGFRAKLYIGEITSEYSPSDNLKVNKFAIHAVPTRKVKWLVLDFERRHVPVEIASLLKGRQTVREVSAREHGEYLFRLAYESYVFRGEGRYVFDGEQYDDDPEDVIPGIHVIGFALAAANAVVAGDANKIAGKDFDSVRRMHYRKNDVRSFEFSFASPGGYGVYHNKARALMLAVALISVANADISYAEAAAVKVENLASNDNAGSNQQVSQGDYDELIRSITPASFDRLRRENRKAKDGVGFSTKADVKRGG